MGILIKFFIINIKENKFRTFLVILSITLSVALFFASLAIADTMAEMYIARARNFIGSAEIVIYPGRNAPSHLFRLQHDLVGDTLAYMVGFLTAQGSYKHSPNETVNFSLYGYQLEDLAVMNPFVIEEDFMLEPFSGRRLLIGRDTANRYGFQVGDHITMEVNDERLRFQIAGIAAPFGLFFPGGESDLAVVPRDTLARLHDAPGLVTQVFSKPSEGVSTAEAISALTTLYPRHVVTETISRHELDQYTRMISTPFMLMLVLVVFISVFIIYTAFKVITRERLPMIGTFRSIGATKRMTTGLMLGESFMYGTIGGILGCGLGFGILLVMTDVMSRNPYSDTKLEASLIFNHWQLLSAFLLAVVLALISSYLPIRGVSQIPIKEIVLNLIDNKDDGDRSSRSLVWVGLLVTSLLLPQLAPRSSLMVFAMVSVVIIGVSLVKLVPEITRLCIVLFSTVYERILGNEGVLAAKNLRGNKNVMNNTALMTIGIATVLMIHTVSYSVGVEVVDTYRDAQFQIWLRGFFDRNFEQRVRAIDGVQATHSVSHANMVTIEQYGERITQVVGIDIHRYFQYWGFDLLGDHDQIVREFQDNRAIIITTLLRDKHGIAAGDMLTLDMARGKTEYKVVGFVNTLFNNGSIAFVPERYLRSDMNMSHMTELYIRTDGHPDEVNAAIRRRFSRERIRSDTLSWMSDRNVEANRQLFVLLEGFSLVTMFIGIFGVFNNFVVSFMSRRKSLAVFRSIGMSKGQLFKMILVESMTSGLMGGLVGLVGGLGFILMSGYILQGMELPINIHITVPSFAIAILGGVVVSVIASISPALNSVKINLVNAIKYE